MRTILSVAIIILAAVPSRAQSVEGVPATQKAMQETGRMLRQAQSNARSEAARQIADRVADGGRLGQLASEARTKLTAYIDFYNRRRPHSAIDRQTPDTAYFTRQPLAAAA